MTDRPAMCPRCLMPLDKIHDPCFETDEGRALDEAIRQANFELAVEEGLLDDDPYTRTRCGDCGGSGNDPDRAPREVLACRTCGGSGDVSANDRNEPYD